MGLFGGDKSELDKGLDAFTARQWKKARRLLEDVAAEERPRPIGDYHLGLLYWRGLGGDRDLEAAVHCFRRAANAGHAAAQTALALALQAGAGAPRDEHQARALFRSAAGAGDPEAMTQLALVSERDEAQRLLSRAADGGHRGAMRRLSELLMADDPVEALAWLYAHVALTGDHTAAKRSDRLARELDAGEIDAAQKRGRAILKRLQREQGR